MIRRYNMTRSDNAHFTGTVTYSATGSGTVNVILGYTITSAVVNFSTLPLPSMSSSSSSSGEENSSSSSSEDATYVVYTTPRIFVSAYLSTGFTVTYQNIPPEVGFFEFNYYAH